MVLFFAVCGQPDYDMSTDAGEIVVCNAVFRLLTPCSVPEIFAIEVRSRTKSRQKAWFSAPNIFLEGGPQVLDLVFKIASISEHVAKFCGYRQRDRGDLALSKKRKKETAAKHKGRVALSQRAALKRQVQKQTDRNRQNAESIVMT